MDFEWQTSFTTAAVGGWWMAITRIPLLSFALQYIMDTWSRRRTNVVGAHKVATEKVLINNIFELSGNSGGCSD